MTRSTIPPPPAVRPKTLTLSRYDNLGLVELRNRSPLSVQLLPGGSPFAWRHESTLLNQLLPGPAEEGLFRLLLRWRRSRAQSLRSSSLVGPGASFSRTGLASVRWLATPIAGLSVETHLRLHPTLPAWSWRIRIRNRTTSPLGCDALLAQDLGIADEGAVRNNEAYTSQYIDLLPVENASLGWAILARQNLPMAKGRHPWLAVACSTGAAEFCTDGRQFFGIDHRLTGEPAALRDAKLPSQRLQQEFALAGLQSRPLEIAPGKSAELRFVARFVPDHPSASSPADLKLLRGVLDSAWDKLPAHSAAMRTASVPGRAGPLGPPRSGRKLPSPLGVPGGRAVSANSPADRSTASLFLRSPWLHGDAPADADLAKWFSPARRHEERDLDGTLLSFFCDVDTHVVTRAKEAAVARPHGHILRSGDARWFDAGHFGITCYAAGIFGAQAYLGHPSFARLLSVVRNALNVTRGSGQRVFVQHDGRWRQLGVPSAFAMTPADVRWIYRVGREIIEARVWCHTEDPVAFLEVRVTSGAPKKFLLSHNVVLDAMEFEHGGTLTLHTGAGWVAALPAPDSMVGRHQPGVCFALAAADPARLSALAGDRLLYSDGVERGGPYVTLQTAAVTQFGVIMLGTHEGVTALPEAVATAREDYAAMSAARPPAPAAKLLRGADAGIARLNDILPWFAHNAAIHFSAPHGLEQYGGAAWGVRDVCQGSLEWLLTAGDFRGARRMLETVFAQQYPHDGSWPQWFMHSPYQAVQQAHSHGDVCFWPVKAACDYVEASNDTGFFRTQLGYTDPENFSAAGPIETVLQHCDRVVAQCEARFIAGTALVNYGDGDWDDTLQPADPALRTRMTSAWTVGLAFHTFRQFADVCVRAGDTRRAAHLRRLCARMRADFGRLMPGGIVAGFGVQEQDGSLRPLLHPEDTLTRIRYRLLPMTRSILAELFTPDEARRHLAIVEEELRYPDGVRLMSEPSTYQGGVERLFKRAETAANVGREVGLQYVHAHLRYAEALAKVGDADRLWQALQVVNPVALAATVPHAGLRQSNTYFSSSDADFPDRYEAAAHWKELRTGKITVSGGWRLYSSGPGIFLRLIRACLLGVRESFGEVVFDPVLPRHLDGLSATIVLSGRPIELVYHVKSGTSAPHMITINGTRLTALPRETNPYRPGGLRVAAEQLTGLLTSKPNRIEIEL